MKFKALVLTLLIVVFAASYMQFSNSQNSPIQGNEMNGDPKVPATKIPPINANAVPLLRALLERVWVTKYYGAPAEIYQPSPELPFCESIPDSYPKQNAKNGVFLWSHRCFPLEIKWEKNKDDLSGIAVVRMLDFDKASEVLEEAFEIIKTNSLGAYRIEEEKKKIIKNLIKENLESHGFTDDFGYSGFLKTYPILEGRFFLEKPFIGASDVTNEPEDIRKYFSHRGKKYALTINYDSKKFVKQGNVIEFSLTAPAGFFGMDDY